MTKTMDRAELPVAKRAVGMQKVTGFFTELMRRFLPDPFVFAIILTILTVILAIVIEGQSFDDVTASWGNGFWSLLAFTTQMAVILAMGYVLANAPVVERLLNAIVSHVETPRTAVIVATLVGAVGSYLNWGFGLVIGGIVAKKLALHVKGVHYPLIIAAAYSGFTMYGLGLSATIPMVISTPGHPMEKQMGLIPLAETIFSLPMLITAAVVLVTLPLLNAMLHPKPGQPVTEIDRALHLSEPTKDVVVDGDADTFASKLNNSRILAMAIGALGMAYVVVHFVRGGGVDLNLINFFILFLGILLLGTPNAYLKQLNEGIKTISGIILQFPFYAGIMAIMAPSGLVVDHLGRLHQHLHSRDAAVLGPDQLVPDQLLRPVRRRPLDDPGPLHDRCCERHRRLHGPDRHVRHARQRLERPGAALLDPAGPGPVQAQAQGHHGLHRDHDVLGGNHLHRRHPPLGLPGLKPATTRKEKQMLFLVRMDVNLPATCLSEEAAAIKAVEKAYSQDLQRQGKWRHIWRVVGEYSNYSVFDAESNDELHDMLSGLPLFPYMDISVTPLAKHPSDVN